MWAERFFNFQGMTGFDGAWYESRTGINIILSIPPTVGLVWILLSM
jgi:hypothetical protein